MFEAREQQQQQRRADSASGNPSGGGNRLKGRPGANWGVEIRLGVRATHQDSKS